MILMKDLFMMVMEADGDLVEPFDAGDAGGGGDATADTGDIGSDSPIDSGSTDQGFDDQPPEPSDDGGLEDFSTDGGDDSGGFGDSDSGDDSSSDDGEDDNKEDKKLSQKANDILNQKLYTTFIDRNSEIEDIINNIQTVVPVLPYDVVKSNDKYLSRLKSALLRGQKYVINDFVDSGYGENLLFYQKMNSLYTLLLNSIDSNLKRLKK